MTTTVPCTADPEAWFNTDAGARMEAARLCRARCPIVAACGLEAMKREQGFPLSYRHGVWGGLTPAHRHHLATREV